MLDFEQNERIAKHLNKCANACDGKCKQYEKDDKPAPEIEANFAA